MVQGVRDWDIVSEKIKSMLMISSIPSSIITYQFSVDSWNFDKYPVGTPPVTESELEPFKDF